MSLQHRRRVAVSMDVRSLYWVSENGVRNHFAAPPARDLFDVFSHEAAFITIYPLDMLTALAPPFLKRSWPEALTRA
jgi:hypothetical protein